jgi:CopG family nickel-responsive transcriptional regulator
VTVERIGVSLEGPLLAKFDAWVARRNFSSRSEALRHLVRDALASAEVEEGRDVVGTITYLYRHDVGAVTHRVLHRQHDFLETIQATCHMHLDAERCLEVLIVRGASRRIAELADHVRTVKGVLFQDVVVTPHTLP